MARQRGAGDSDRQRLMYPADSRGRRSSTGNVRKKIQENESSNKELLEQFIGLRCIPAKGHHYSDAVAVDDYSCFPPSLAPTLPTSIHVVRGKSSKRTSTTPSRSRGRSSSLDDRGMKSRTKSSGLTRRSSSDTKTTAEESGASKKGNLAEMAACMGCAIGAPQREKEDKSDHKAVSIYWDASRQRHGGGENESREQVSSPRQHDRQEAITRESTGTGLSTNTKTETSKTTQAELPWVLVPGVL